MFAEQRVMGDIGLRTYFEDGSQFNFFPPQRLF